jgi:enoyl-CoA hydratase/carnithine racemase
MPAALGLDICQEGPVLRVTLRREPGNHMSMDMCRALTLLLEEPPDGARLLHLEAEGPAFCLGRDRRPGSEEELRRDAAALVGLNKALGAGRLVTVAEVAGDAAGYGVGLAALCDLSFAAPAARFCFPEVEIGLAPTVVLSWLPALVGRAQAFRLTASGVSIDGRQAAGIGLVTAVSETGGSLSGLVAAEIDMLLRHPFEAQLAIRSFMRETAGASPAAMDAMSVEHLVANSLRLGRAARGAAPAARTSPPAG